MYFLYKEAMKEEMIGVRLETKLRSIIENIAEQEQRSLSNLVRLIIIDWLKTNKDIDWLKESKK
jgi:predicted DNA-binding ribbon-helix-helix protein